MVYLDYNATAPLCAAAREAMKQAMGLLGNPSSPHAAGRRARALIEQARSEIASFCSAEPENLIFTSSGTEANSLALQISPRWFISAVEHISVKASCAHDLIAVDEQGLVCLERLRHQLTQVDRPFVSVMLANNETGVIQPIAEIAALVKERGGFLHCDAVQAAGKMEVDINKLGADSISLSAHKLGGAAGVGALVFAKGVDVRFEPLIKGGGQELGQRAGTENLIGIAAFAAAVKEKTDRSAEKPLANWRDRIETSLPQGTTIFGKEVARLNNTSCFALPNMSAQKGLILFDLEGICLSAGAACSSGKLSVSPTLLAQGVSTELAQSALRLSLGAQTTLDEVNYFIETAQKICNKQTAQAA